MRILIISNLYPPYAKGGHEYQCQFAAEVMAEQGHEVFVLTSRYGAARSGCEPGGRIDRSFFYYTEIRSRLRRLWAGVLSRANYFVARKALKRIRPDLAYVGQLNGVSVFPLKALKRLDVPLLFHVGHYYFCELARGCILEPNPLRRFINQRLSGFYRREEFDFRHMLTVSSAIKAAHVAAGYAAEHIALLPPMGVPEHAIVRQPRQADAFAQREIRVLYVGRLTETKGVHVALEALRRVREAGEVPALTFRVIGKEEGSYLARLQQIVAETGMQSWVRFEGFLPAEQVAEAYTGADLLLVPSLEEPFGLIIIEAMARGLPVVASAVGGIVDIITPEETGLLAQPGDAADLARKIAQILRQPELYARISRQALEDVRRRYSHAAVAEQLAGYIRDLEGAQA